VYRIYFDDDAYMSQTRQDFERRNALAQVVENSVLMEVMLRAAFCALMGSKYAAIVAGGQDASWLIGNCRAIVKFHRELPEDSKAAINDALKACLDAYERRNLLVHAWWDSRESAAEAIVTRKSRRRTFEDLIQRWTVDEIHAVVESLEDALEMLFAAMVAGMGEESMDIGNELRREERQSQQSGPSALS
jgi:hypothetical protein